MKKLVILSLCLLIISCMSNEENRISTQVVESEALVCYEKYKQITLLHNEILNDFYQYAINKGIKYSRPISDENLDEFLVEFISSIKEERFTNTRAIRGINMEQIKYIIKNSSVLFANFKTRSSNSDEDEYLSPYEYLDYFCDELLGIDIEGLSAKDMDNNIKVIINHTCLKYYMSDIDIQNLSFVAAVAYNSYIYWYNEAGNWYNDLSENGEEPSDFVYIPTVTRGFWRKMWGAVESGTQKWYEADVKGATSAILTVAAFGGVIDVEAALIGAAASSWKGAIENFGEDMVEVDSGEDDGDVNQSDAYSNEDEDGDGNGDNG